jgi:hypothetical protein
MMGHMPAIPEPTRSSIILRLLNHAGKNWPQLVKVRARYHGSFAYITGLLRDGEQIPLFRLRYGGSAHSFGFAIYSPARDRYEDAVLLTGCPSAARKKHSTPPAPSTSQDSDTNPNPDPRRTYGVTHLRRAKTSAMHLRGTEVVITVRYHLPAVASVPLADAMGIHRCDCRWGVTAVAGRATTKEQIDQVCARLRSDTEPYPSVHIGGSARVLPDLRSRSALCSRSM